MTMIMRISPETVELAAKGDSVARSDLLDRYRDDIRRMIATRLDRRLASRIDASDIVQETLTVAAEQLDEFFRECPITFFGWLRQIAAQRLIVAYRVHLGAERRSVARESRLPELPDDSAIKLGSILMANDTSPSNRLLREEGRVKVTEALASLSERHREVLVMRFLEHLRSAEIAEALGISEGAVESRILRALIKLRGLLEHYE